MSAARWIRRLQMVPHPEGGFFREAYRSHEAVPAAALPARYGAPRAFCTAIYFLLQGRQVSHLHRLKSDEAWHHYDGAPLTIHTFTPSGPYRACLLGKDPAGRQRPFVVVKAGTWFGATLERPAGYALVGCTVAPGFDFADFELADRAELTRRFPRHKRLIALLTPGR